MVQEALGRQYDRTPSPPRLQPPAGPRLRQRFWRHLLLLFRVGSWRVVARSRCSSRTGDHHCKSDPSRKQFRTAFSKSPLTGVIRCATYFRPILYACVRQNLGFVYFSISHLQQGSGSTWPYLQHIPGYKTCRRRDIQASNIGPLMCHHRSKHFGTAFSGIGP